MADPKPSEVARKYLASIGAKGRRTVTAKKRSHLEKIAAKDRNAQKIGTPPRHDGRTSGEAVEREKRVSLQPDPTFRLLLA